MDLYYVSVLWTLLQCFSTKSSSKKCSSFAKVMLEVFNKKNEENIEVAEIFPDY
jgi:hypothetical protein